MACSLCVAVVVYSGFAKTVTLQLPLQRPSLIPQGYNLKNNFMLNVAYQHQGAKQCGDVCAEALWFQASFVSSKLLENATECLPVTISHGL